MVGHVTMQVDEQTVTSDMNLSVFPTLLPRLPLLHRTLLGGVALTSALLMTPQAGQAAINGTAVAKIPSSAMAAAAKPPATDAAVGNAGSADKPAASATPVAKKAAHKKKAHKQASSNQVIEVCDWVHPGVHPFMGNVVNAIDRYTDIPVDVRARLKERMEARQFDEFVAIERDGIIGKRKYDPGITEMHFGNGKVCRTVTRTHWTTAMRERGLVYCEQNHCILVPTVCRNVSRIRRLPEDAVPAPAPQASTPEEDATPGGGGGGYSSSGYLVVQARRVQEAPTCGCGSGGGYIVPLAPSLPPFTGGFGGPSTPLTPTPPTPATPIGEVPEPQTWLMYALGIAALGMVARRRKQRHAKQGQTL